MALRKPLVLVNGQLQQLQDGDLIDGPIAAVNTIDMTNADANDAIVKCAPVYVSDPGEADLAQANAAATARVLGLAHAEIDGGETGPIQFEGFLTALTAEWDAVTGQTGGLTIGDIYYLSAAAAGKLVVAAPGTVGHNVTEVGHAISTTQMRVEIRRPILL